MKRILHVVTTMDFGGVETLLMNLYRNIDRNQIQFDFLCMNTCDNLFSEEIKALGGKMYAIPFISKCGYFGFQRKLKTFFETHTEYDTVHTHINSYNGYVLEAAKKAGVQRRISHVHAVYKPNTNIIRRVVMELGKKKIKKNATHFFACSGDARDSFYEINENRKKCTIIKNVIDVSKFTFFEQMRNKTREQFNCSNDYIVGMVGRLDRDKNQLFALDVFRLFIKKNKSAQLWLIGEGPNRKALEEQVAEYGLKQKVVFWGVQDSVPNLMAGMDALLMPSLVEGFGIVAIEAQSMGLPVIASEAVPKETELTELITYLKFDVQEWTDALISLLQTEKKVRNQYSQQVKDQGYDVCTQATWLQDFYLKDRK